MINICVLAAYVCLLIAGCTLGGIYLGNNPDHYYSGKITIESVKEYTQFKRAIGQDHIGIDHVTILASEPPIIVDFTLHDYSRAKDFNWGTLHTTNHAPLMSVTFLVGLGIIGLWWYSYTVFCSKRTCQ